MSLYVLEFCKPGWTTVEQVWSEMRVPFDLRWHPKSREEEQRVLTSLVRRGLLVATTSRGERAYRPSDFGRRILDA